MTYRTLQRIALLVLSIPILLLGVGIAAADERAEQKRQIESVMTEYLKLWNAHDAAAIIARIYRLDADHPWRTKEGLQAEFDRLKAQGYDHSEPHGITGCIPAPGSGLVELRFTRLKTDGSFMPPKDRVSVYTLKLFADGWRATGMKALPEGQRMECK